MWMLNLDKSASEELSFEEMKYRDLQQENAILKQELNDLYSHLMILDDTNASNEHCVSSSAGRLVVYDKVKRDTEVLLQQEGLRQQAVLLEKEVAFQRSHITEQAAKMKQLEGKLLEARETNTRLSTDVVSSVAWKSQVADLTTTNLRLSEQLASSTRLCSALEVANENNKLQESALQGDLLAARRDAALASDELGKLRSYRAEHENKTDQHAAELREFAAQVQELQIAAGKAAVQLAAAESDRQHWERKSDSQRKEITRLTQELAELQRASAQSKIPLVHRRAHSAAGEEADDATAPLMRTAAKTRTLPEQKSTRSRKVGRGSSPGASSPRGATTRAREARSPTHSYQQLCASADGAGGARSARRAPPASSESEDCMCGFFPSL